MGIRPVCVRSRCLLVVLLLAGCAATPPVPAGRATLVLRLTTFPSMSSHADVAAVPRFSLYGGGRLIRPGGQAGALSTAEELTVDPDQSTALHHAARDAGFDRDSEYSNPDVIDGAVVVLTVMSAGHRYTTTAANPPRSDLRLGRLFDLEQRFAQLSGPVQAYRPARVFALGFTSGARSIAPPWPLRPFSQAERSSKSGMCLVLDASEATAVAARSSWSVDGIGYDVRFRPVLPDEGSCADL